MKKYIISIIALLPLLVFGQTYTENFIKSTVLQQPHSITEIENGGIPNDHKIETVLYYDGIGRPTQKIAQRAGGNGEDLVTPIYYDGFGRQPKDYLALPSAINDGDFYVSQSSSIDQEIKDFYKAKFPNDFYQPVGHTPDWDNPFSEKVFDNSLLSEVLEQGAPGMDWRVHYGGEHTVKFETRTNHATEVRLFTVDFNTGEFSSPELIYEGGYYDANNLLKKVIKDENWLPTDGIHGISYEYTNKKGQIVLKRSSVKDVNKGLEDPNYHDTYYVYDDFGNLTFVLSPEASDRILDGNNSIVPGVMDNYGYQYKYDYRNRLIEKKIPGKSEEYILYDDLDRPVLTQDAIQRNNGEWLFTKYDKFDRVAYTGIFTDANSSRSQLETILKTPTAVSETRNGGTTIGNLTWYYTNWAFPTINLEVLTVNYFDDYVDNDSLDLPSTVFDIPTILNPTGLPTVSKVRVLDTNEWITSLTGYDDKGRVLITRSKNNYLDTEDYTANQLDFIGKVIESFTSHSRTGNTTIHNYDYFTYDHMGRLLSHKQKIDNEPAQLIAYNNYDELGQLTVKGVGGVATVDGYTDLENVDVASDGTITSTSSTYGWPARAKTKGEIPSGFDGGIDCIIPQIDRLVRIGLVETANSGLGNNYFDYGIDLDYNSGGNPQITVSYIINGTTTTVPNVIYAPGDLFRVKRVGETVKFYWKNSEIHSEDITTSQKETPLTGKMAFNGPSGASVENALLFGPEINNTLQTVNYAYNVRGWLTDINNIDAPPARGLDEYNDLFNFRINYNRIDGNSSGTPLYNGNIAQTLWKSYNDDPNLRSYNYYYDDLNRITEAEGFKGSTLINMLAYNHQNVDGIEYDLNGNIELLNRRGSNDDETSYGYWDKLSYSYDGNQLQKVTDNSTDTSFKEEGFKDGTNSHDDYVYDANGNMTKDLNKNIHDISYNHLNLPVEIKFDPVANVPSINYIYDATGVKLSKSVIDEGNITTLYAGNYIYNDAETGQMQLEFFNHPEGYIEPVADTPDSIKGFDDDTGTITYSAFSYVFQYKDHLGNIRLSYSDNDLNRAIDGTAEIIEESNYYPFGLKQKGYNNVVEGGNDLAQNWKYNGKELNQELSLEWLDYGARNYLSDLGRYFNIDRMAEAYFDLNPYQYTANNPVKFIDVNGDYIYIWENGEQYRYANGEIQKTNEKGKWIKHSAAAGSYLSEIQNSLDKITGGDPNSFGSLFLGLFENDDISVFLQDNPVLKGDKKDRNFTIGKDIYTSKNQSESIRTTGGSENLMDNFYITLAHELAHGLANNLYSEGALKDIWVKNVQTENGLKNVRNSEIFASMYENMLRSEQGLDLRTHYIGGTSDNRSRLITKSKTKNPFQKVYNPTKATLDIFNTIVNRRKVSGISNLKSENLIQNVIDNK